MEDSEYPCIILASDGVWNMVKPDEAVRIVSTWRQNYKVRLQNSFFLCSHLFMNEFEGKFSFLLRFELFVDL